MNISLFVDSIYLTITTITIILFSTSLLLNPRYTDVNFVIDRERFRLITKIVTFIFVISTAIKLVYQLLIFLM